MRIAPALTLAWLAVAGTPAWAQQDPAPTPAPAQAPQARITAVKGEDISEEGADEQRWIFLGMTVTDIRIEGKEFTIRADRAVTWSAGREKKLVGAGLSIGSDLNRFYAEGHVVFARRDIQTHKTEVFRAERFYLDVQGKRGYFLDLRLDHRPMDETKPAITLRAAEARLAASSGDETFEGARSSVLGLPGLIEAPPGRLAAFDVVLSSCAFGDPHYSIGLSEAQVDWKWAPGPLGFFRGKPEDPGVGGNWVTVTIWGVPVFAWPSFYLKLAALSALPLEKVQGGKSSRFGNSIETQWGVKLRKGLIDSLNPFDTSDDADNDETWGRLRWEIDWRQNRGWAAGLDPSWKWGNYEGYIDSYYLRDEGPDPDNDFDAKFVPLERTDRGRIRGFHRTDLSINWRYELEASWLSDRNVLEEFFPEEFKEGKEQETVAYLRFLEGNRGGFLMARARINDFQTQVEFLPKVKFFLADEPPIPGTPLGGTLSQEIELAGLRKRFDDELGLPDQETWRIDSLTSLSCTVPLAVATFAPFAEARVTSWERGVDGNPQDRFIATAGASLAMDAHAVYDVKSDLLNLHDLRHILHLEGRATTAFSNTLDPSSLFGLDEVDTLENFEEISLELRNVFQTKYVDGQELRIRDYLEVGAEIEFYPEDERDTVGFNPSNFSAPFNWITLGPHDASKVLDRRNRSNVHWDTVLRPGKRLEARASGEYNPVHNQEEVREYTVTLRPQETLALSVGQVFIFDVTNAFTVGVKWDLTEKWLFTADFQYDFKTSDFTYRKAAIGRALHDFQIEAVYEEDAGRDEKRFYVTFAPSFIRFPK